MCVYLCVYCFHLFQHISAGALECDGESSTGAWAGRMVGGSPHGFGRLWPQHPHRGAAAALDRYTGAACMSASLCAACCRVWFELLVEESNLNCIDKQIIKLMSAETRCNGSMKLSVFIPSAPMTHLWLVQISGSVAQLPIWFSCVLWTQASMLLINAVFSYLVLLVCLQLIYMFLWHSSLTVAYLYVLKWLWLS
jgi:hypothetical protein